MSYAMIVWPSWHSMPLHTTCRECSLLYLLDTLAMAAFNNSGSWQKIIQTTLLESYRVGVPTLLSRSLSSTPPTPPTPPSSPVHSPPLHSLHPPLPFTLLHSTHFTLLSRSLSHSTHFTLLSRSLSSTPFTSPSSPVHSPPLHSLHPPLPFTLLHSTHSFICHVWCHPPLS